MRGSILCALSLPIALASAALQDEVEAARPRAMRVLRELFTAPAPNAERFVDEELARSLVERVGRDELARRVESLCRTVAGASLDALAPEGALGGILLFGGSAGVELLRFRLEESAPQRIVDLWLEDGIGLDPDAVRAPPPPPLTWETLDARFEAETAAGFSGAALLVRDGEVVLHRGFGLANREKGIAAGADTVFAIGSTPIDFTKAAVLLLIEDGALALDATLGELLPDAPRDKRAIRIDQLMTGRSGLPDFHDLPSDRDVDHAWIDRDEALRRILGAELLFEPGRRRAHSHSAWVLLAALVEIQSERSYTDFVRERLFAPAGMRDTGFFGEPIAEQRLAIGYGIRSDGEINAPPYWGRTSWLVMGSGGMTSTAGDIDRWLRALRAGKVLSAESLERYWSPPGSVLEGGDAYGFEIVYTEGVDARMILLSNSNTLAQRKRIDRLGRDIAQLLGGGGAEGFSLGVELTVQAAAGALRTTIARVVPGSAAEQAALLAGDRIIAIDGVPLTGEPRAALAPALRDGRAVSLQIERAGEQLEILVTPKPR